MNKKLVFILIQCLILILFCCSCSPSVNESDKYGEEIDKLNLRIGELQSQYEDLQNKLDNADKEIKESRQKQIEYQNEINLLKAKVTNLSGAAPEFTEQSPHFLSEYYDEVIRFDHHDDASVSFKRFVRYCKDELSYNLIFLAPIESEYDIHPNMFRSYAVLTDNRTTDSIPIIYERLMMYSEVLGSNDKLTPREEGPISWSIDMEIYIKPVEKPVTLKNNIELRFGSIANRNYINIIVEGQIIATCYYRENVYVSANWYENYFINNLCYTFEVEENQGDELQNYVLKISADKQVYEKGEDIVIDITFENRSGADVEIAYYLLFYPESSTGQFPEYEFAPVTTKRFFKNGETIHETNRLGGCFLVGHHELKYRAVFYLTWKMTEFGYENTDDMIEVWSNTVEISVIEIDTKLNEKEFLQQFDLSDSKIAFSNQGIDFCVDRVMVILKKSVTTNLKINLENFCLNNGERIDLYDFGNYDNPNYRHMLTIYLKEHGTEKVVEAVTELNKLEFVKFACPVYIYGIQDD